MGFIATGTMIMAILALVGGIIFLYIRNKNDQTALRESIAAEYTQSCDTDKKTLQQTADDILNKTIAEKDALIEQEKTKCQQEVAAGNMTADQANKTLQDQLNKAQADIATVKDELQKQIQINQQKRVCSQIKGVRKAGGGYMMGGDADHLMPYGDKTTLEACEISCKNNADCKQFVWHEKWGCYPMNQSYVEGTQDPEFTSGTCSS